MVEPAHGDTTRRDDRVLPLPAPDLPRLGAWLLEGELGRGGMGVVFAARHAETGREAALKVLPTGHASIEERLRFDQEARAAARVAHPHVVAVLEAGHERGRAFLVMERVRGPTLLERVRQGGPLPTAEAAALGLALARALEAAHAAGVLHRDVKPSNVLLAEDGRPRLADFGLARVADARAASLTATGQWLGTPGFMAPEQARSDRRAFGPATDVYGLGATLYFALTGAPPFVGPSALAILEAVEGAAPPPPRAVRPDVDPALERLVLACLAKDPAARPASAAAVAAALEGWLDAEGARAAAPPPSTDAGGDGAPPTSAWRPRLAPAAAVATAAVALALVALAAALPGPGAGAPLQGATASAPLDPAAPDGPLAAPAGAATTPDPAAGPAARVTWTLCPGPGEGEDTCVRDDGGGSPLVNAGHELELTIGRRTAPRPGTHEALLRFALPAWLMGGDLAGGVAPRLARATLRLRLVDAVGLEAADRAEGDRPAPDRARSDPQPVDARGLELADRPEGDRPAPDRARSDPQPVGPRGDRGPFRAGLVASPWRAGSSTEGPGRDGVVWVDRPRRAPDLASPPAAFDPIGRLALDVTALAQAWRAGAPAHGLVVWLDAPAEGVFAFASAEHPDPGLRPRLELELEGTEAPPPPLAPPAPARVPPGLSAALAGPLPPGVLADPSLGKEIAATLERTPSDPGILAVRAARTLALIADGDDEARPGVALRAARRALRLSPPPTLRPRLQALVVDALLAEGAREAALATLGRLLDAGEAPAGTRLQAAKLALALDRRDEAAAHLEAHVAEAPAGARARAALDAAQGLLALGLVDAATDLLADPAVQVPQELRAERAEALALLHARRGREDQALRQLDLVARAAPSPVDHIRRGRSLERRVHGFLALAKGPIAPEDAAALQAASIVPSAEDLLDRAELLARAGRLDFGAHLLDVAARSRPTLGFALRARRIERLLEAARGRPAVELVPGPADEAGFQYAQKALVPDQPADWLWLAKQGAREAILAFDLADVPREAPTLQAELVLTFAGAPPPGAQLGFRLVAPEGTRGRFRYPTTGTERMVPISDPRFVLDLAGLRDELRVRQPFAIALYRADDGPPLALAGPGHPVHGDRPRLVLRWEASPGRPPDVVARDGEALARAVAARRAFEAAPGRADLRDRALFTGAARLARARARSDAGDHEGALADLEAAASAAVPLRSAPVLQHRATLAITRRRGLASVGSELREHLALFSGDARLRPALIEVALRFLLAEVDGTALRAHAVVVACRDLVRRGATTTEPALAGPVGMALAHLALAGDLDGLPDPEGHAARLVAATARADEYALHPRLAAALLAGTSLEVLSDDDLDAVATTALAVARADAAAEAVGLLAARAPVRLRPATLSGLARADGGAHRAVALEAVHAALRAGPPPRVAEELRRVRDELEGG